MRHLPALSAGVVLLGSLLGPGTTEPTPLPRMGDDPVETARELVRSMNDPKIGDRIDDLGGRLSVSPAEAEAVLGALEKDPSLQADTLRAELLVWIARGEDIPRRAGKVKGAKVPTLSTDRLGPRAGALLSHEDPFVRGLAEWALSIRLGSDYEGGEERAGGGRVPAARPGTDAPPWYRAWASIPPEDFLELDYVRQAAALGWHRTTEALLRSADVLVKRAEGLASSLPTPPPAVRSALDAVRAARRKLTDFAGAFPGDLTTQRRLWLELRRATRAVVMADPALDFGRILFATRRAALHGANITAGRWNQHPPGGDIFVKTGLNPQDPVRPLIDGRLGPGHVRGLDLWWDADRLVFAYARQPGASPAPAGEASPEAEDPPPGGYFGFGTIRGRLGEEENSALFEMKIDGSSLRRLTGLRYNVDQEPAYLPNGDIVFVSDRSNYGSQCAGALDQDNMILNLHRCDPDGRNVRALTHNKDFDRHPHVMDTGQILFLRWEYQERHLWQTHTLWTSFPDGRLADALYKQHLETGPMSLREARQVYGRRKLVAIACGHHSYDQGAVMLVDYSLGVNRSDGMRLVTPKVSPTEGGYGRVKTVEEGGVQDNGGHYMFPYPLSDRTFLACYSYKRPERLLGLNFGLYLIDVWGHKELIHRDRFLSVAFPLPLRKTPRPPLLPDLPAAPSGPSFALAHVANVHASLPGVKPGTVRYLRISQKVPWPCVRDESKPYGFNDLHYMPTTGWTPALGMWDWGPARVIGTVPVEADGSAFFKVPANQPVYFQALDKDFLEVRRMRSNVTFRAGESRGCVGCHESNSTTPAAGLGAATLAARRPPSVPVPPPWGDREIPDYERHLQPVFERHCVRCHGETDPAGGLEFTSRKIHDYMQSYRTLFGLRATDPTPILEGYWKHWHPDEPIPGDPGTAKEVLKRMITNQQPGQLVAIANFQGGPEVTPPLAFGSGTSRLTTTLLRDDLHRRECRLPPDDWQTLVTWVDLNAQYWGTFVDKDPHFRSRRTGKKTVPCRRVRVIFPDPWLMPPAGEWIWKDPETVILRPGTG